MSVEFVLFIILAAVAIFSAAAMLISRNAVHSALFLVTNFMCVALFYLMLNAPFLGMIQVTVYAGAIMVLFIFVIMLLGAEQLGSVQGPYRWIVPIAVLLTVVFFLITGFVVLQTDTAKLTPVAAKPEVRLIHAIPGAPEVEVYFNDTKALADKVAYKGATAFGQVLPGAYTVKIFAACASHSESPNAEPCADPIATNAKPLIQSQITLESAKVVSLVAVGTVEKPQLIIAPTNLTQLVDEGKSRLAVINTLPDGVSLVQVLPGKELNLKQDFEKVAENERTYAFTFKDVAPFSVTSAIELTPGKYDFAWSRGDVRLLPYSDYRAVAKTADFLIIAEETVGGVARPVSFVAPTARIAEYFGSPQAIGVSMLSDYLLPFELVSLLLLAALVGAIILTREDTVRRSRKRVVVTEGAMRINRAQVANTAINATGLTPSGSNVPTTNAESSAD